MVREIDGETLMIQLASITDSLLLPKTYSGNLRTLSHLKIREARESRKKGMGGNKFDAFGFANTQGFIDKIVYKTGETLESGMYSMNLSPFIQSY